MTSELSILIQQPIIPDYRMGLFKMLKDLFGGELQVVAGDADFGGSPKSTEDAWLHFERVKNHYISGGLLWQSDVFWRLLKADVVVLNANMRILSNDLILMLRKILGRQTLLWGHVEGQSVCSSSLRRVYLRLSSGFVAYTKSQAEMLSALSPRLPVWVAANSCVYASDCRALAASEKAVDSILYVGRLVKAKKVGLLLEGYRHAREVGLLDPSIRLVFVGDGDERFALKARVEQCGFGNVVEFKGHISDVGTLREQYRKAACSVSPGYVGLSATQSFSFGIPMLIAQGEFHSPEIEACREGMNAKFFEKNDPVSLAEGLAEFVSERRRWLARREEISEWTKANYSFEAMRDAFVQAIEHVSGERN